MVVDGEGRSDDCPALVREERSIPTASIPMSIADLGSAGTFLVVGRSISEAAMEAAIQDGTEKKQLRKHWKNWEGKGEVALAVRLDAAQPNGRLYTYLPIGEQALSPFARHLHGSFFPDR